MDSSAVREQFEKFLNYHLPNTTFSGIDKVLIEYIVNVLEQLGDDECFDLDEFVEMMAAYIPGFETIKSELLWKWMMDLVTNITEKKEEEKKHSEGTESNSKLIERDKEFEDKELLRKGFERFSSKEESKSSTDEILDRNTSVDNGEVFDSSFSIKVEQLSELFPGTCSLVIKKCLLFADGDVEEAASWLLSKDFRDEPWEPEAEHCPSKTKKDDYGTQDKKNLKDFVINRYLYVDVEEDKRTHRPVTNIKHGESKKMIRYLNNQVVSTKGERYTQIKPTESEEMKKTYVNLKPARKYRFH